MRVLALVTDAYGGYGGIARYNQDLLAALSDMDAITRVDVFARVGARSARDAPGKIRFYPPLQGRAAYGLRVAAHCLVQPPDLVFNGHIYHSPLSGLVARVTGAKLISQLHGTEVWEPMKPSILRVLKRSDRVLCVSGDTRRRYLEQIAAGFDNSHVLHNTVGDEFRPGDRDRARSRFGLTSEYALLSVGRLDARNGGYKGHDRVIRALPALQASGGAEIIYLIAGIGDDWPRLEALAVECGVSDRVRFLGKVPRENLPDLYRAADLFVLPSTGEGFGIVYLEAMACGTPAIGLAVGGVPDAFLDGELKWCVEEAEFEAALQSAIVDTTVDRNRLADRIRTQFGAGVFAENARQALTDAELA